jgi:NodT family efflux transporter outer membrane factor (OMF) lipoprotein
MPMLNIPTEPFDGLSVQVDLFVFQSYNAAQLLYRRSNARGLFIVSIAPRRCSQLGSGSVKAPSLLGQLLIAVTVAGCSVGPNYQTPFLRLPAGFLALAPSGEKSQPGPASGDLTQWWRSLHDQELNSLEDRALQANLELEVALDRIQEARALLVVIANQALPVGGATGGGGVGTGSDETRTRAAPLFRSAENNTSLRSLQVAGGFGANWDLDLFGKVRRALEAQTYDVEALKAAWDWVMATVTADVARAYLDMRAEQARLAVLEEDIAVAKSGQDLQQTRFDRGLTNELDVALARRELATLQAQAAPLEARIDASRNAIAILLGTYPENLARELAKPGPIPTLPRRIPTGAPVDLLRRRPDIAEAERRVAAGTARIGVAVAQLFPDVFLTGAGGGQGGIRSSYTVSAANWIGSIGPGAYWPLLDFGALDAQIEIADLTTREQLAAYKQSILTAVQQVDDATVSYRAQQESLRSLDRALAAAKLSTNLASDRYDRGLTDYLNVLDAERQQFDLEQQYVSAQQIEAESLVGLYKALGGGWQPGADVPPLRAAQPAAIAAARYLSRASEGVH